MAKNRFEKRDDAIKKEMRDHVDAYKAIYNRASEEDRDPTEDERLEIEEHHRAILVLQEEQKSVKANIDTLKSVDDLAKQLGPSKPVLEPAVSEHGPVYARPAKALTPGEQFVMSEQYKSVQAKGITGTFSTGQIQLKAGEGTLLEGSGAPGDGWGGGLLTAPTLVPGVVETLFQPLSVADVLPSGQTTTNTIQYTVEGTATSGAAGVAEGAAKPASDLALSTTTEPVKKIATILTISDEMLEDAAQVQSYINSRLSLFVRIEEESQILRGGGTNDLVGIMDAARSINTYPAGTADNNAVAIFKALQGTRGSALLEPDTVVMHPTNWQATRLLTDTAGQFFGGGPFTGAYGNAGGIPVSADGGQLTGAYDTLWGKRVIVTTAVGGAGTALVGSFRSAAQLWRRSGLSVEATNSHSDYFTKNLVALRAEERLALAVYRPSAFTAITGLD